MWKCPKCGEEIEDEFDSCWKCAAQPEAALPAAGLPRFGADHLLCAFLVFCFQLALLGIGWMGTEAPVAFAFALLAFLLPIPGYAWALRDAPLGLKTSRRFVRITIVGLAAFGLSLVGFIGCFVLFASHFRVK